MSRTPSGPSMVTMFQVNATRSRQKQSSTNRPAAASMSLVVRALSKSANHLVTTVPVAGVLTGRSVVVSVIDVLQVVGLEVSDSRPDWAKYPPVESRAQGELRHGGPGARLPHNTGCSAPDS